MNQQILLSIIVLLLFIASLATYKFLRRKQHCMELLAKIAKMEEKYKGVLVKDKNGFDMLLVRDDDSVTRLMVEDNEWEPHLQNAFRQIIKPKAKVLVLGGHFGTHVILISKLVGNQGKLSVFEANPNSLKFLNANLVLNNVENTTLYPKAAFSKKTTLSFVALATGNTGSSHIKREEDNSNTNIITVDAVNIDSIPEIDTIDVLQMDIEGAEADAVYGATKLIDKSPNLIVFQEWTPAWIKDKDSYLNFWRSRGYKIGQITAHDLCEITDEELKNAEQIDIILAKNLDKIILNFKPM